MDIFRAGIPRSRTPPVKGKSSVIYLGEMGGKEGRGKNEPIPGF